MNITVLDIINYIKKNIHIVIISAAVCIAAGILFLLQAQHYTASTVIHFVGENVSTTGMDDNGNPIDPYAIISPNIIEKALNDLGDDSSVDVIRNAITITPIINQAAQEQAETITQSSGEKTEYYPTDYIVSFRYSGKNDQQYGIVLLNKIMEYYDEYIQQSQVNYKLIADVFSNINYEEYDYMDICDLYETQLSDINDMLEGLAAQDPEFRSTRSGLTFNDLRTYIIGIQNTEYAKLYSYVRAGVLTKNKEVLIKNYQYKINELTLEYLNQSQESEAAHDIMNLFYQYYKEGQQVNQEFTNDTKGVNDLDDIIDEDELNYSDLTNTYDDIILRYVNQGTSAIHSNNDIAYYNILINDYMTRTVAEDVVAEYTEQAEYWIDRLDEQVRKYVDLANITIKDYNVYKGTEYVTYLASVTSVSELSGNMVILFAATIGIILGLGLAVVIELWKRVQEQAAIELRRKKMTMIESGKLPEDIDSMPPLDQALFRAINEGFREFKLVYIPVADSRGRWIGAEALIRWESPVFGLVMPNDFIAIAEKYEIMELLGKWIMREACSVCKKWNNTISENFFVTVNFSLQQISSQIFIDNVVEILNDISINPSHVYIELNNAASIDTELDMKKINAIKAFGVKISVDNFNRNMFERDILKRLPVDMVKIDRNVTARVEADSDAREFVSEVVDRALLHNNMAVCAEGVENENVQNILRNIGVEYFQGYYYSKPVSAETFEQMYLSMENK